MMDEFKGKSSSCLAPIHVENYMLDYIYILYIYTYLDIYSSDRENDSIIYIYYNYIYTIF